MGTRLIIVMYHYIRSLAESRFPAIKGLEATLFREQLSYLASHHEFVRPSQLIAALAGHSDALPNNGVLLTFDDGYRDHYEPTMSIMQEFHASGIFFVPSRCIERRQVLDVNKIHFLLASVTNPSLIAESIDYSIEEARRRGVSDLLSSTEYRQRIAIPNRFDSGVVIYVKRMLQHVLPLPLRHDLLDGLFAECVSSDEAAFADELYLTTDQLAQMQQAGMLIGSHGSRHIWMNKCDKATQATEIDESLVFLDRISVPREQWMFCYPYGGYNSDTLELLTKRQCVAAFTTEVGLAEAKAPSRLLLPRLDTNDLPKDRLAEVGPWSAQQFASQPS